MAGRVIDVKASNHLALTSKALIRSDHQSQFDPALYEGFLLRYGSMSILDWMELAYLVDHELQQKDQSTIFNADST